MGGGEGKGEDGKTGTMNRDRHAGLAVELGGLQSCCGARH